MFTDSYYGIPTIPWCCWGFNAGVIEVIGWVWLKFWGWFIICWAWTLIGVCTVPLFIVKDWVKFIGWSDAIFILYVNLKGFMISCSSTIFYKEISSNCLILGGWILPVILGDKFLLLVYVYF